MRSNLILITSLMVVGCSMTLPVHGDFNKGQEKFLGSATGQMDGSGTITMTTESGVRCNGKFQYDNPRVSGAGDFNCDDGRKGSFNFTSSGDRGTGFGRTTDGKPFKFVFGHNDIVTNW